MLVRTSVRGNAITMKSSRLSQAEWRYVTELTRGQRCMVYDGTRVNRSTEEDEMEQAQLIQAAASIAGGMAAAHYDKFSGLVAARITEIAETAVKIALAIETAAARKSP